MNWMGVPALAAVVEGAAIVPAATTAPLTMAAPPPGGEEPRENPISEFTSYDELLELDR